MLALVIPAAYATTIIAKEPCNIPIDKGGCPTFGLLAISRGTAVLLLIVYCAYLFFQVGDTDFYAHHPFLSSP